MVDSSRTTFNTFSGLNFPSVKKLSWKIENGYAILAPGALESQAMGSILCYSQFCILCHFSTNDKNTRFCFSLDYSKINSSVKISRSFFPFGCWPISVTLFRKMGSNHYRWKKISRKKEKLQVSNRECESFSNGPIFFDYVIDNSFGLWLLWNFWLVKIGSFFVGIVGEKI